MTEVWFYHLQGQPLERVLPNLLERSLERGWRIVVQAASDERVEALDAHLWTYRDDAFLPHGTDRDGEDPDAVAQARECWSAAKASGFDVTYWQPDEQGRWQRKS